MQSEMQNAHVPKPMLLDVRWMLMSADFSDLEMSL
jgi:hypothetical protein